MIPRPPTSTLFPYTTLFRSDTRHCLSPYQTWQSTSPPTPVLTASCPESTPRDVETMASPRPPRRSEEHTSELQSRLHLVCRLLLEKKKKNKNPLTQR